MKAKVLLRRAAELDLAGIEDWYESQRPGLGTEFREMFDELVDRVSENPFAFPARYRGSRRALLRRFPYVVWYSVQQDVAVILACVHARRDPRLTRSRLHDGT